MPTFVVTTWETVRGTYKVKALSEAEAREKFGGLPIDWEGVEQHDYQAFEVEVRSVERA